MNLKRIFLVTLLSIILAGCSSPVPMPAISIDTPVPVEATFTPSSAAVPTVAPTQEGQSPTVAQSVPPAGDGKVLMDERCSVCHSLDRIQSAHKTADEWASTVARMIGHSAVLSADEQTILTLYLSETYK